MMPRKIDRSPRAGFPKKGQFATMAEVDAYLSGNLIQCLECGHFFRSLARHLKQHGFDADQYREKFGIPWGRGLISSQLHTALSELAKAGDIVARVRDTERGKQEGQRAYCRARRSDRMAYTADDYYQVARRVIAGEPLLAVCKDVGVPGTEAVRQYRKFDKEFNDFWVAHVQPKIVRLQSSARVRLLSGDVALAKAMLARGERISDVAKATGYSNGMVRLILHQKTWVGVEPKGNKE